MSGIGHLELVGAAQHVTDGSVGTLRLRIDGSTAGVLTSYDLAALRSCDCPGEIDVIHLISGQLVGWLASGSRGLVGLTLGATAALAPDIDLLGPTIGAVAMWKLPGPLSLEGQLAVTSITFVAVDSRAALVLRVGALQFFAGYRYAYLNDKAQVDDVERSDTLAGPFAAIGFTWEPHRGAPASHRR
ncbi:MAG: hypothetical protein ACOZIN_17435 [Myxococcota bacterium]